MPSFATALSGLESNNTALNTIANNLANMNTVGYKDQTDQFSTLFYQQLNGGVNGGVQVGVGTQVATTETDFSDGGPTSTGQSTDMALQGNGFFVIDDNGQQELTRAGDFVLSQSGALQTTSGASVMGYPASNGSVTLGSGVQPIVLPLGQTLAAKQTGSMNIQANLDASAAVGTNVPAPVTLYDSLGGAHQATVTFTKTGTNTWSYSVALPAGEAASSAGTTGTLTFDGNGNLTSPTGTVGGISFSGLSDGASNMSFSWNLGGTGTGGAVTQTATASNVASATQDGYTSGSYQGFSVDGNGIVEASFSNGQKEVVGQVAVASVANQQGLQATNNTAYVATLASGSAVIGTAGNAGRGTIEGGALESSNVDVSTEFSALIVAQRAFEANSKSVTTFDQATQEAINMIH
ncbi:MAG TPA: flagellar hook protein FlgE [Edaphobacter sp.]|nr:flagellar hook protein FlgE [Edaphobacter sp.]